MRGASFILPHFIGEIWVEVELVPPLEMLGDLAILEFHGAGHSVGEFFGVGDGDESDVFLGVQFHEQLAELVGGGLVECAGGFIGEQELGLVDERTHHGHALAFAAGELAGPM